MKDADSDDCIFLTPERCKRLHKEMLKICINIAFQACKMEMNLVI